MKKQILAVAVVIGMAAGAMAQGSINIDAQLNNAPGVTLQGTLAGDTQNATTWYDGNVSLAIYYAASVTPQQLAAINAFQNVGGGALAAMGLLGADGFALASTISPTSTTTGSVIGDISDGTVNFSVGTIGLTGVPTSSAGYLAIVMTALTGVDAGYEGILAFANNTGGSPLTSPPGTAANLTGWGAMNQNMVLSSVPEPGTMALAGLGSLSLFLFRRKK